MNWLKKGPELKMPKLRKPSLKGSGSKGPGIKPPAFVADLYYDLRDRRLLPLIALVVVAIAAVPILLGGSDSVEPPPVAVGGGGGAATASASLAVVEAKPGLRDYRKRLGNRTATDPFKQRYTGLPESAQVEVESSSSGSAGATAEAGAGGETIETAPSGSASPGGSDGGTSPGSGSADADGRRFYAYRPTIRFGPAGEGELNVYKELSVGKLLPQEKPIMFFTGASEDGNRIAFNLSREVTWVRGPGQCVSSREECSLLFLRAGQAVDIMTTMPGRTFRLHVVKIEFVEVDRPKPAESSAAGGPGSLAGLVVGQFGRDSR
ncbi:MAG TPA: hypothetical protein VIS95_05695 [Solirubrobacterales bacterium]